MLVFYVSRTAASVQEREGSRGIEETQLLLTFKNSKGEKQKYPNEDRMHMLSGNIKLAGCCRDNMEVEWNTLEGITAWLSD